MTMEKLQVAKKHRLELDWILIMSTDKDQSFKYLKLSDYKMTCSHIAVRRCNVHPNTDLHKMSVSYYTVGALLDIAFKAKKINANSAIALNNVIKSKCTTYTKYIIISYKHKTLYKLMLH